MKVKKMKSCENSLRQKTTDQMKSTTTTIQPQVYLKFLRKLNKSKQSNLITGMSNYYGKNFPINYKSKYNFNQRWQGQMHQNFHDDYLFQQTNPIYSLFCLITLICNFCTIWTLSVQRYFQTHIVSQFSYIYPIMVCLQGCEITTRCIIRFKREERGCFSFFTFLRMTIKEIICMAYLMYLWISSSSSHVIQYSIQIFICYLLWREAAFIYKRFKVMQFALRYQNQVKIFDLLCNIFIQAHVFAILMFCSSKIDPNRSWTNSIVIGDAPVLKQYLYSFYFACTTMLTIGYGDITPKNEWEVLVVISIQIVGVVSFGYLLNEMGHTLSKMRQESEALEKDLQTIGKMSRYYNLQKSLENRAKTFLLTNQALVDQLKPDDQNKVMMKLNDELRTQINNQNSLTILKTCIFFLCHWSKGFQSTVAKHLQKKLYYPNQRLGEMSGIQRLYIIKKGKVCVYMSRFGSNQDQKKLLKVIKIDRQSQVSNNLFGYTMAFSNRPVHLEAIAKQFSSTYSITKQNFLLCVNLDKRDFQYYHQIKCKIDQSAFCQQWEAPAIKNIRQHYIPSRIFLIKKYRNKLQYQYVQNHRKHSAIRRPYKKYALIGDLQIKNADQIHQMNSNLTLGEKTLQFAWKDKMQQKKMHNQIYKEVIQYQMGSNSQSIYSSESLSDIQNNLLQESDAAQKSLELARQFIKFKTSTLALDQNQNKKIIAYIFESRRDFINFFPRNNLNHVLQQLQKQNFHQKRLQTIRL